MWCVLVGIKTYLTFINNNNIWLLHFINKTSIIFGILAVWYTYDNILKEDITKKRISNLFQYTFFLYAFHEPPLTIIKKVLYYLLGVTENTSLLIYILAPIITISIVIYIGSLLKKITPSFYSVLTGGR